MQHRATARLVSYAYLIRLDKPIGTLLLLWPTWWALWLASGGFPEWSILIIFTLGTFLMRSAGCAVNDYADRDFDRHVQRTQGRPVTSGKITGKEALGVAYCPMYSILSEVQRTHLLPFSASSCPAAMKWRRISVFLSLRL